MVGPTARTDPRPQQGETVHGTEVTIVSCPEFAEDVRTSGTEPMRAASLREKERDRKAPWKHTTFRDSVSVVWGDDDKEA